MRRDITVMAEARPQRGKNEARRLRVRGLAPAIVYGAGREPVPVAISPKEVNQILRSATGSNTIFTLDIPGQENTPVMVVDVQNDPVKGNVLHLDLKRIDVNKHIRVRVPVRTHGDPKGVKVQGGLLELITREVEIDCLPDDIPSEFAVDVSELMIGQSVRAADLPLTGSVKLLSPPDSVIAHVIALRAESPAGTEAAAAPAAEPEVIKKGKKEEEGAAEGGEKGGGDKGKKK
jgi:large subunit ribosomal protein L25